MCDCTCPEQKKLCALKYQQEYERLWKRRIFDVIFIGTLGYLAYKLITYEPSKFSWYTVSITDSTGTVTYKI